MDTWYPHTQECANLLTILPMTISHTKQPYLGLHYHAILISFQIPMPIQTLLCSEPILIYDVGTQLLNIRLIRDLFRFYTLLIDL